jgi:hypothetical protein
LVRAVIAKDALASMRGAIQRPRMWMQTARVLARVMVVAGDSTRFANSSCWPFTHHQSLPRICLAARYLLNVWTLVNDPPGLNRRPRADK